MSNCAFRLSGPEARLHSSVRSDDHTDDTMLEGLLSPMHLLFILGVALVVLGPKRLPEAGRGLGSAIRGFKESLSTPDSRDDQPASSNRTSLITPAQRKAPSDPDGTPREKR
jgi:sec-independent protein translocase protein TatA